MVTEVGPGWSSNNTALPLFVTLKLAISFGIHDTCFVTAMQGLIPFYEEGERSHGGQHLNQDFSWSSLFRKVTGRNQSIKDQKVEVCPRREVWLEVEQAKKSTAFDWLFLGVGFFFFLLPIYSPLNFNKLTPDTFILITRKYNVYKSKTENDIVSWKAFKYTKLLKVVVSWG